ncbi:MAG: MCP four helix bundle domain-containing protein [Candidatus Omnitrophica bacterium]|nr:MCP four helix bundle domain-containing protein [Candidatus Omnitrophota bacterium]
MKLSIVKPVSLNAKMLAGSLTLGALIVAIGALAVHMSHTIARSSTAILVENVSSLKAAEELEIALLDQKGIVGSYLLDGDEKWLRLLEEKRRKYDEWFARAKDVALTGHEQRILERIRLLYQEYDRLRFQVIRLAQDGSRFAAQQLLLNRVRELVDQLYDACEELLFFNEQLIAESQKKSQQQLTWFQAVLWSSIAVAIFLGLLGGWMVARGMTKRLVQSEKLASLGHMAGLVAHEVRNPLTAIKMRVHSLQEELAASVSSQDDVEVIRQEIERLERIVQNFLDLVRLPEPRVQPLSLNEVVTRAVELLKPNFEEHAVRVTIAWPGTLPSVQGDAEQLEQVFLNLLLNAVQAMPEGGAIEITASWVKGRTETDGSIEIAVSDTGPGIPKALRDKIFDPFFTTKANGIGLGLSLAKKVVEQHQGVIEVQDRNGSGAAVTIRLPAKQPVEALA